jgi:hypothetical protein
MGSSYKDLHTFMAIFRWILFRIRNVSDKLVENQKHAFYVQYYFFLKSCLLWDNVLKYGRDKKATDDDVIRRMRFSCWITKTTHTHPEYVILIGFSLPQYCVIPTLTVLFMKRIVGYISCLATYVLIFYIFVSSLSNDGAGSSQRTVSNFVC